jgi:hypothetical protein
MYEIELVGIDGTNLLGYLAALGTLRVLTVAEPRAEVRVRWVEEVRWTPIVCHSRIATRDELIEALAERLCGRSSINPAWEIGNDLTLAMPDFRAHLEKACARGPEERGVADFLAAFGSDALGSRSKKGQISDTEFRTMSGAGHQHFLGFMRELADGTAAEHLRRALLDPWDYADGRPSLRWDATDYRPHALRAEDPSGDPIRTMRGANRLAVEALPLFPTVPERRRLRTVAFEDTDAGAEVAWPIWSEPLSLDVVAALLACEDVQKADRSTLARRGVAQVFRAKRFTDGQYRNFSPARALL